MSGDQCLRTHLWGRGGGGVLVARRRGDHGDLMSECGTRPSGNVLVTCDGGGCDCCRHR